MTAKSKRRMVVLGIVVAVAAIVYSPLLRGLAECLVVDEPTDDFQYLCVLEWDMGPDGDRCYDVAGDLYRQKPSCRILLLQRAQKRLDEIDRLPSFEAISRRELEAQHVPRQAVSIARSDGRDDWATARALRAWLVDRPDASIVLLCGSWRSAHVRYALDAVLDPDLAARVRVRALPDRRFDETNWWTSRIGIKAFGFGWLRRFHEWCADGDCVPPPFCSANDYECRVRRSLPEGMP